MNLTILNREFQHPPDGFYQIEAKGYHPAIAENNGKEEKVVQVIDDKAITSIVNRFNEQSKAGRLRHGSEMLIDREHLRHEANGDSRAYGWTQELAPRPDGIYARNRWTATGRPAVDGGDFRFFSTEYDGAVFEEVPATQIPLEICNRFKDHKFLRPLQLTGLSLTNQNNNRGQRPITNRETFPGVVPADNQKQNKGQQMKSVCTLLGLSAEADETSVHAAVAQLKNRITTLEPLEATNTTLKNRQTELETENMALLEDQTVSLLDAHGVKDEKVRNRLKPIIATLKNREERVATLVDFGFKQLEAGKNTTATRILNRQDGNGGKQEVAQGDAQELAQKAESEINEYKLRNRCTYAEARNSVRTLKPELFGLAKQS